MTPTEAAREIVNAQNTHVRHNLSGLYGPDIARALLAAEEREREYKRAIDEIDGTNDLSLIYCVIYNLRFKLGQDPATERRVGDECKRTSERSN